MSQQNVEVARRAHAAFNRPDINTFDLEAFYRYAEPDMVLDCWWSRPEPTAGDCVSMSSGKPETGLEPVTPCLQDRRSTS